MKGGLYGSAFLNCHLRDIFAKYIEKWFVGLVEEWRCRYTRESRERFLDTAMADFEVEKNDFDGFSEQLVDATMNIHMRGILENIGRNTKPGRIMVPR